MKRTLMLLSIVGFLFLLGGAKAGATCVICGSGGSCYDQPSTYSGNCECSITSKFGSLICKPKGVCDPLDSSTCQGGPGTVIAEVNHDPVVDSRFLDLTAEKNAPLASALWGAMDQELNAGGVLVQTHLSAGEHTGTLGTPDHRSFKYKVQVRQLDPSLLTLKVTLEEEGVDGVQRYDGALYHNGLQGELAQIADDGSGSSVVTWDFRPKPDRGGKDPRSSQ